MAHMWWYLTIGVYGGTKSPSLKEGETERKGAMTAACVRCPSCPVASVVSCEAVSDMSAKVEFRHSKPSAHAHVTTSLKVGVNEVGADSEAKMISKVTLLTH